MANKKDLNVKETEKVEVETEVVEEGKFDKVKVFAKKHGKKLAVGAGLGLLGIGAFVLGRKSNSGDDEVEYEDYEESETESYIETNEETTEVE